MFTLELVIWVVEHFKVCFCIIKTSDWPIEKNLAQIIYFLIGTDWKGATWSFQTFNFLGRTIRAMYQGLNYGVESGAPTIYNVWVGAYSSWELQARNCD